MSWWSDLTGRWKKSPAMDLESPVRVELIPGRLAARVHVHEYESSLGHVPCWTYVTEGMIEHRQREVVLSLRREPGDRAEAFPQPPLRLFHTIYDLASRGNLIDVGDCVEIPGAQFFGGHVICVQTDPPPGIAVPPWSMTALIVTDLELRACRSFGFTRVLALYGEANRYYPFPPWSSQRRPGYIFQRAFEESLLTKIPVARTTAHLRVRMEAQQIIVTALRGPWQQGLLALPAAAPFALTTDFDPMANAALLWQPGQREPTAITPPGSDGSRPGGSFVAFVGDQPLDGAQLFEDGYVAKLTAASWQRLRTALVESKPLSLPADDDGFGLTLEWDVAPGGNN